jgi:hypothetical protein
MGLYDEQNKRRAEEVTKAATLIESVLSHQGMKMGRVSNSNYRNWSLESNDKASGARTFTPIELRFPYTGYHSVGKLRLSYSRDECRGKRAGAHGITNLTKANIEKWAKAMLEYHRNLQEDRIGSNNTRNKAHAARDKNVTLLREATGMTVPNSWSPDVLQDENGVTVKVRTDGTCSVRIDIATPTIAAAIIDAIKKTLA